MCYPVYSVEYLKNILIHLLLILIVLLTFFMLINELLYVKII